jgi:hypothetical protein
LANPKPRSREAARKSAACEVRTAVRRLDAPPLLRLWHLSSLDAPTVAAVWALGFAWAANVHLPLWIPALLALVAWTVYIGDRLLDVRATLGTSGIHRLRERHHFHWRHRRILLPLAIAAACVAAWIVFFLMPVGARERNSALAAAALAYFTRVHSSRKPSPFAFPPMSPLLSKEFLVGLLFTFACAIPAWSRSTAQPGSPLWPLSCTVLFFVALAWLNCHAIDRWESRDESHRSSHVFTPACLLALAGLLLAAILSSVQPRPAALVAAGAASALLLALLDRLRRRLTPLALRAAADLVLLTPVLITPALLIPLALLPQ